MSKSLDGVIPEILKLYDMIDEHKTSNPSQQINVLVPDNAAMEPSCSDPQENVTHQPSKLLDDAKECHIECF